VAPIRVAVVGDNCIDVYQGDSVRTSVGGNALNVAIGLSRLGISTEYIGEVGSDRDGDRVIEAATQHGVGADHVHVLAGETWRAFIVLDGSGTARVRDEDPGACGPFRPGDSELDLLATFDHVHMANLAHPGDVVRELRARGVSTSYDYGTSHDWRDANMPRIAFASCDGESALDRGLEVATTAVAHGAQLAIVTLGAAGSLALDRGRVVRQLARPIEPIDTLGAGDSYIAAFLASFLGGSSVDAAMRAASEAASVTCLHWAAWPQPGLPMPQPGARS
jgi:fructoselysine 6-kinase